MGKKLWIILGIILLVIVAGAAYGYLSITGSSTVPAQLHVESGAVTVNGNPVTGTVKLDKGDTVATTTGKATVMLYESVLVMLEPDTSVIVEALLKTHPKVNQPSGTTWNSFTKLAGVEGFTTKAGRTVASVRGTGFIFSSEKIVVGEGTVKYTFDREEVSVSAGHAVDGGVAREANAEELASINSFLLREISELRQLRQLEINKHPTLYAQALKTYGIDQSFVDEQLAKADAGKYNIDELVAKSPIKITSVQKVADITKAIQKINQNLAGMNE